MLVTESVSLSRSVMSWKRKKRGGRMETTRTGPQHVSVDGNARGTADCHFGRPASNLNPISRAAAKVGVLKLLRITLEQQCSKPEHSRARAREDRHLGS
jgi:hypothetical protein